MHGRLGDNNVGPRDAPRRRCIVGMHHVCVGFVVFVLVGEGVCTGLPYCGVVDGVRRFEGSLKMELSFSSKCCHSPNKSQYHNVKLNVILLNVQLRLYYILCWP